MIHQRVNALVRSSHATLTSTSNSTASISSSRILLPSICYHPPSFLGSKRFKSIVYKSNQTQISHPFSTRSFSFQAALAQQQQHQQQTPSISTSPSDDSSSSSTDSNAPQFKQLAGKISESVYKALTGPPFNYSTMSEVQARVLTLLPDLSQPSTQIDAPGRDRSKYQSESGEKDPLQSVIGTTTSDGLGKDMLVKARTGTGKTLAFLVPAIEARIRALKAVEKGLISSSFHQLLEKNRPNFDFEKLDRRGIETLVRQYSQNSVGTLIISPTRELATQIANEATKLQSRHGGLNVQLLVGGQPKYQQISCWRNSRPDVVVATPGRLMDLARDTGMIREALAATERLILDEADTLLEMGFRDDIQAIINFLPENKERVTSLFSATVSKEIRSIARDTLNKEHRFIDCVPPGEENVHRHIPQFYSILDPKDHYPHILRLIAHDQLINAGKSKVILFCPTTKQTELMSDFLREARSILPNGSGSPSKTGGEIYEIHSKKDQNQRFKVSDNFRKDQRGGAVLVTSDVSARGVDYPGTTRVIQIGIPSSADQYIHRVGRTGRAGKNGRADLILLPVEKSFVDFHLNDLPVKHVSADTLERELMELTEKFDQDPESIIDPQTFELMKSPSSNNQDQQRKKRSIVGSGYVQNTFTHPNLSQPLMIRGPLSEKLSKYELEKGIDSAIGGMMDYQERLRETFGGMLGYYMSKVTEIRASKPEVLKALKDFTFHGLKAEEMPHVSASMLRKLGIFNDSGSRSDGGYGGSRNNSGGSRVYSGSRNDYGGTRGEKFARGWKGARFVPRDGGRNSFRQEGRFGDY